MRVKPILLAVALLLAPAHAYADKLKVVASFSIIGDMVHQVAGDMVDLKVLVGPDSDTHVYEPTPADAKALGSADLVIINGLGFEGWIGQLIVSSSYGGRVAKATDGIHTLTFEGGLNNDPHAWQSLENGKIYVANIRDALIQADLTHADIYRANAATYLRKIEAMDKWATDEINNIPEDKRKVISNHDAFQYFSRQYHVHFIAPQGLNPESTMSAAQLAQLMDQIRNQHIHALFMENISDSRLIKQLETDTGATIGGTLYSDALSPAGGPASDYLALFAHNVSELTKGMLHNQ